MSSLKIPKITVSRQNSLASMKNYQSFDEVELDNLLKEEGLQKFDDNIDDATSMGFEEDDSDDDEFSGSQVKVFVCFNCSFMSDHCHDSR